MAKTKLKPKPVEPRETHLCPCCNKEGVPITAYESGLRCDNYSCDIRVFRRSKKTLKPVWPRIRDLPKEEQAPFKKWLEYQTVPEIQGALASEQDAYYQHDYDQWKQGGAPLD